jgi:hypothetical protein
MNRCSCFLALLPCLSLCGAFLFSGCMQGLSGTEVGNPATVTGKVYDDQNNTVANAAVFLVAPDYNPALDSIAPIDSPGDFGLTGFMTIGGDTQRVSTRTNDKGEFVLNNVVPHAYNLFITDSGARRMGFRPGILVNERQVDLGACEVRSVGYAMILVPDSLFTQSGYISVLGTPIKMIVDSAGEYTVPVIYDSLTISYYARSGDSLSTIINGSEPIPNINSGDTLDLTGIETIIIPPVVAAIIGNDTLYSPVDSVDAYDTVIRIAALGATINKNGLIEYQFYEATQKTLIPWSINNVYSLRIGAEGEYSVACRVRSKSNTSVVTGWTTGLLIRVRRGPDTIPLPAPSVPIPLDTVPFSDSVAYRFLVRDSAGIDTPALEHRLRWYDIADTANSGDTSSWSRDSIFSIRFHASGTYHISAQARSAENISGMSLWSDTLLFTVKP